jgi:hypothetical protein
MEFVEMMLNGGNSVGSAAAICEECSFLARNFTHVSFVYYYCPTRRAIVWLILWLVTRKDLNQYAGSRIRLILSLDSWQTM